MMIDWYSIETILMMSLKWSRETVKATEVRQSTRPRKDNIMTKLPNKEELVALIMANTDEFKKTHLMLKPVTEVRDIAAKYTTTDEESAEAVSAEIAHADDEPAPDTAEPIQEPVTSVTRDEDKPTVKTKRKPYTPCVNISGESRNVPAKVIDDGKGNIFCPNCDKKVREYFGQSECPHCNQALNWRLLE
jgi:hypothetical protein